MLKLSSLFALKCKPAGKNYVFGSCYQNTKGRRTRIQEVAIRKYSSEDFNDKSGERVLEVFSRLRQKNLIRFDVNKFEEQLQMSKKASERHKNNAVADSIYDVNSNIAAMNHSTSSSTHILKKQLFSKSKFGAEWTPQEIQERFVPGTSLHQSVDVFPFDGDNDEIHQNNLEDELETFLRARGNLNKTTFQEETINAMRSIRRMLNKFIPEKFVDLMDVQENPYLQTEDRYQIYDTDKKPGLVMLFSQEKFVIQTEDRPLNVKSKQRLSRIFTHLGFDVELYSNLYAKDIERTILQKSNEEKGNERTLKNYNCLIVCMMSHGSSEVIMGSDLVPVSIRKMQYAFNSKRCPSLHNKPKIFITNACREKDLIFHIKKFLNQIFDSSAIHDVLSQPVFIETHERNMNLSPINDFFCAMSSLDGFASCNMELGVTNGKTKNIYNIIYAIGFIPILCSTLEVEQFKEKDIEDVFKKVQAVMSQIAFPETESAESIGPDIADFAVQTPERISTLRKKVVFRKQDARNTGQILIEEDFSINEQFVKSRNSYWNKLRSLLIE